MALPLIPQVGRRRLKTRLALTSIAGFLWLGVLLHLFPVAWMISASLKPTREIFEQPFNLLPAHPSTASYNLLFTTVTAVVVGGTALSGGEGGVLQTLVGVMIVSVLSNGMVLMGIPPSYQTAVQGLMIIVAVALSIDRKRIPIVK